MSGIIAQNSGRHTGLVKAASAAGVWNLILTQTASASATIDFTSGLDSTYDEYVFKFINIHPSASANFTFQGNAAGGADYDETITSSFFISSHAEGDTSASVGYNTDNDQAQGTGFQRIGVVGTDNDSCTSGVLHLFNPSSTTFIKHFFSRGCMNNGTTQQDEYSAGYFNTTSAIDEIQFKMSSGNIDAGTISLYGIS